MLVKTLGKRTPRLRISYSSVMGTENDDAAPRRGCDQLLYLSRGEVKAIQSQLQMLGFSENHAEKTPKSKTCFFFHKNKSEEVDATSRRSWQ